MPTCWDHHLWKLCSGLSGPRRTLSCVGETVTHWGGHHEMGPQNTGPTSHLHWILDLVGWQLDDQERSKSRLLCNKAPRSLKEHQSTCHPSPFYSPEFPWDPLISDTGGRDRMEFCSQTLIGQKYRGRDAYTSPRTWLGSGVISSHV